MQTVKVVGVALLAAGVGGGLALLYAPASGAETRRKIAKRVDRERKAMLKSGQRAVSDVNDYIEDRIDSGRRLVDGVAEQVSDRLESGRKKIGHMIRA